MLKSRIELLFNKSSCERVTSLKTKTIVYVGLMTAITFVMTRFLQIPLFGGYGYAHFGDSIIYTTAFLMGGAPAAFVGGIGGALADLTSGYAIYALPTLIIKSGMAFVVAVIYKNIKCKAISMTVAFAVGGVFMTVGYFVTEVIIYHNVITPLASIPMNLLQVVFSVPIPILLTRVLKSKIM